MTGPRCDNCKYDLHGIPVSGFTAICPECGTRCDIREGPAPVITWWHEPAALAAGALLTICIMLGLAQRGVPAPSFWAGALLLIPGPLLTSLLTLRTDLAVLRYNERSHRLTPRAWRRLALIWLGNLIAVPALPILLFVVIPSL